MTPIIAHPAPEAHPDRDAAARKRADRLAKATTDQMQTARGPRNLRFWSHSRGCLVPPRRGRGRVLASRSKPHVPAGCSRRGHGAFACVRAKLSATPSTLIGHVVGVGDRLSVLSATPLTGA